MPVAAGAADIDRIGRGGDWDHPRTHRPRSAGDLAGSLAALRKRDQERGNVLGRQPAIEHRAERGLGLVSAERSGRNRGQDHATARVAMPHRRRKLASRA